MYIIKSIKHKDSMKPRTDGKYPSRIGSTVYFFVEPMVGCCAYLVYIKDNQGNERDGILRTSTVAEIKEENNSILITTHNSVFELEKC